MNNSNKCAWCHKNCGLHWFGVVEFSGGYGESSGGESSGVLELYRLVFCSIECMRAWASKHLAAR